MNIDGVVCQVVSGNSQMDLGKQKERKNGNKTGIFGYCLRNYE